MSNVDTANPRDPSICFFSSSTSSSTSTSTSVYTLIYATLQGPTILPLSTVIQVRSYPHMPYVAHKRLVTFVHTPIHSVYHTGTPIPIRIHSRVRPSVLAAEYNRIRDLPRASSRSYTERYLNSKDNIFFDDETRRIRAKADSLLRRIHVFVPRPSVSDFHEETDPERLLSDDYIRRLLGARKNVRKEIESASWYAAPEQRALGKGNLACVEYVGGKPHSRRRPYFRLADLRPVDIKNDVNLLSFYSKNRQAAANASPSSHLTEREIRKARAVEPERTPTSDTAAAVPAETERSAASFEIPEAAEPAAAIELEEIVGKKKEKKEKKKDKELRKAADEEALRKAEEYLAKQAEEARLEEERRLIAEEERLRLEREEEEARLILEKAQAEARQAEIEEQERLEAERREAEEREEAARLEEERIAEEERVAAEAAEAAAAAEEERQAALRALEEERKKKEEEELLAAESAAAETEAMHGSPPVEGAEADEETQQEQEEMPVETIVNEEPQIDEVEVGAGDDAVLEIDNESSVQEPVEVEGGDSQPVDDVVEQAADVPQIEEVNSGGEDNIWGDNEDA